MKYQEQPSCNNCDSICGGAKSKNFKDETVCKKHTKPDSMKVSLLEAALTHPQSLHETFSNLPLSVTVN